MQIAMGFITVANETMCRPIRALTTMKVWSVGLFLQCGKKSGRKVQHIACLISRFKRNFTYSHYSLRAIHPALSTLSSLHAQGYDASAHALACFGGAGGQHACAIARSLGMRTIFVHRCGGFGTQRWVIHKSTQ